MFVICILAYGKRGADYKVKCVHMFVEPSTSTRHKPQGTMQPNAITCVVRENVLKIYYHHLCLGFHGKHGARCSGVRPITEQDKADIAAFPFSSEEELAQLGATAHVGEQGFGTLERQCGPCLRC